MQLSQFLRKGEGFLSHYCPACLELHTVSVERPNELGCRWQWDGDTISPTFFPSVDIRVKRGPTVIARCHYFLHRGILKFQPDCTQHLKGITMALPALPDFYRDRGFM